MNDRIIEIENYWTRVVRDTAEFQQIADAENPEFNTVLKCLYNILKDGFINDLTENGAMRWEKILGLPVAPDATLEERKVQILTYLSIRRPYTWRVLKQMLTGLLGEDKFEISLDNDTQTLTIDISNDVLSKLDQVKELSNRVIPQNLVVEYDSYPFPISYTRLEYLESTGTQYIGTDIIPSASDGYELVYSQDILNDDVARACFGGWNYPNIRWQYGERGSLHADFCWMWAGFVGYAVGGYLAKGEKRTLRITADDITLDGTAMRLGSTSSSPNVSSIRPIHIFGNGTSFTNCKVWLFRYKNGNAQHEFIPALDPTGAPCMYDLVTRTPFYNSGTGDFIYPTDAAPAVSADLDEKFYAKRTEHGIRRLYHVPEGCTMSKDEYAAKNGFKEILEPPMPQEGYWVPEWRETETQLICEWVETEPPTEEGIEND